MAAEEGFEPSQTDPESVVLPLHNSAIERSLLENTSIISCFPEMSRGNFGQSAKEKRAKDGAGKAVFRRRALTACGGPSGSEGREAG